MTAVSVVLLRNSAAEGLESCSSNANTAISTGADSWASAAGAGAQAPASAKTPRTPIAATVRCFKDIPGSQAASDSLATAHTDELPGDVRSAGTQVHDHLGIVRRFPDPRQRHRSGGGGIDVTERAL